MGGDPFQSHAGSIEAIHSQARKPDGIRKFQSHAGSIEAKQSSSREEVEPLGFNPTLVRLRQQCEATPGAIGELFQSHAGSIEAGQTAYPHCPLVRFQSHAGSIEAGELQAPLDRGTFVSIPRWFD